MPAKELKCDVRNADAVRWVGKSFTEMNEGVAIWQLVCNAARLQYVRIMMNDGIPCFLEVDDDYTEWDESVANSNWTPEMPTTPYQASVALHKRAISLFEGVICATDRLAEVYSKFNKHTYVARNSICQDDWKQLHSMLAPGMKPYLPPSKENPFRILWMASASHRIDQRLVLPALEWAATQPNVEVYLFGPVLKGSPNIIRVPWVDHLNYGQAYRDKMVELQPDIGICVIRDTDFARGKSDLKALEYIMAGALPIVSPLEPYKEWDDRTLQASTAQEWVDEIKWCINNPEEVHAMHANCLFYVMNNRLIEHEASAWLNAVRTQVREVVTYGNN